MFQPDLNTASVLWNLAASVQYFLIGSIHSVVVSFEMVYSLFGNGTDIVHWKASPTTRGTFDILTICLTTLLLCIWTAVHLNVAPPESTWSLRLRKIGWLFLTLIAPEMVAYTAWCVYCSSSPMLSHLRKMHTLLEVQSMIVKISGINDLRPRESCSARMRLWGYRILLHGFNHLYGFGKKL